MVDSKRLVTSLDLNSLSVVKQFPGVIHFILSKIFPDGAEVGAPISMRLRLLFFFQLECSRFHDKLNPWLHRHANLLVAIFLINVLVDRWGNVWLGYQGDANPSSDRPTLSDWIRPKAIYTNIFVVVLVYNVKWLLRREERKNWNSYICTEVSFPKLGRKTNACFFFIQTYNRRKRGELIVMHLYWCYRG